MHDAPLVDLYNYELLLTGVERVGGDEGDLLITTRREQLENYQTRWLRLEFASTKDIPLDPADSYDIVGGMLAWRVLKEAGTVQFLQMASNARGVPLLDWQVRCPEKFTSFKMDPASNVLATLAPVNK